MAARNPIPCHLCVKEGNPRPSEGYAGCLDCKTAFCGTHGLDKPGAAGRRCPVCGSDNTCANAGDRGFKYYSSKS